MVYNRLEPILDAQQSKDQAGFRRNRSTVNHLFTMVLVQEIAEEWKFRVWTAAVDFKKAFDSVTHRSIWRALAEQGVAKGCIKLLDRLYKEQVGIVRTGRLSEEFCIEKGVKQGDPLSSLLFNCVSEYILRPLKQRWSSKGYGIKVKPEEERLTNLRFADDIFLISDSLESMTQMIEDLSVAAADAGLALHPDKTKILRNKWAGGRNVPGGVIANGMEIEVLGVDGNTKYLGRKLTFTDPHRVEVESRIAAGWKRFHAQKQELMNRDYSLNDRLRLSHGTVSPTVLYGCEAWTLTQPFAQKLRKAQRSMTHKIFGKARCVVTDSAISGLTETQSASSGDGSQSEHGPDC